MTDEEIFEKAIELPSDERTAFLANACSGDSSLHSHVARLVDAHFEPDSILGSDMPSTALNGLGESVGEHVGPYKLLQKLGEGGMGTVYLAERLHPVKQRVALKIIKRGMDSKKFIARFEAERQALAMMDHPNIAKVFDAGTTESGRPYFVMELVKGIPITQFCDDNQIGAQQRIELLVSVCHAVQHAHQKGIIHRDLKPSNVLVAMYDDQPVPKVIDFGLAKAANQTLTEKTLFTEVGSILGTWEYMSPEQAVLNQLDVDTRTDVYSLGVILYELMTGVTPLDRERLRTVQLRETLRMIQEDEPAKPSTRITGRSYNTNSVATYQSSSVQEWNRFVRGDLDWVTMKSLEKDRKRRYESASRLAEDLQRFLAGDAVEARPPTLGYRIAKFTKRNRAMVSTALIVATVTLLGLIGTTAGYLRTRTALDAATRERWRAEQAEIAEKHHRQVAEQEKATREEQLYVSDLVAAHAHFRANNVREAVRILHRYAPGKELTHLRTWEWGYLWKKCSRAIEAQWLTQEDVALSVDFSPDGKLLAIGRPDQVRLMARQGDNWTLDATFRRIGFQRSFVRFLPSGHLVYQEDQNDGLVFHLLGAGDGDEGIVLKGLSGCPDFSKDGRWFTAVAGDRLCLCSLEAATRGEIRVGFEFEYAEKKRPLFDTLSFTYSSVRDDTRQLATVTGDGGVVVWDFFQDAEPRYLEIPDFSASCLKYLPGGDQLCVGGSGGEFAIFDPESLRVSLLPRVHRDEIRSIKYSESADCVAIASRDGSLSLWTCEGVLVEHLRGHSGIVQDISFSPTGKEIASASQDYSVGIWPITGTSSGEGSYGVTNTKPWQQKTQVVDGWFYTLNDGDLTRTRLVDGNTDETELLFSNVSTYYSMSPRRLLVGTVEGACRIVDPESGTVIHELTDAYKTPVRDILGFTVEDELVLVTMGEQVAYDFWTSDDQFDRLALEDSRLPDRRGRLDELPIVSTLSLDGSTLVCAAQDNVVRVIDTQQRRVTHRLEGHRDEILDIDVSQDGSIVVTGSFDNTLRLWRRGRDGYDSTEFRGHSASVRGVVLIDEGRTVVSTGGDLTTRFWDTKTARERMLIRRLEDVTLPSSVFVHRLRNQRLVSGNWSKYFVWDSSAESEVLATLPMLEQYLGSTSNPGTSGKHRHE